MFMNARTRMMSVLGLSLAVLGAAAWAGDEKEKGKEAKGAKVGEAAPAFTLKDTKGQAHSLSDFAGKIVVIEWFNNDCPYCVNVYEKGVVKKTLDQLKEIDTNIVYLAINSTANKPMEDVVMGSDEFLTKNNIDIPLLLDYDGKTGHAYGAKTTPHMFVIDDKGDANFCTWPLWKMTMFSQVCCPWLVRVPSIPLRSFFRFAIRPGS
jgi:peroxiredoxin